jgi:hypothetical protein
MWKFVGLQLDSRRVLIPAVLMLLLHTNGCTGLASKSSGLTKSTPATSSVSVSGNTLSTSATIYNSYSAGTNVYFVLHSHQSTDPVPMASNVDH